MARTAVSKTAGAGSIPADFAEGQARFSPSQIKECAGCIMPKWYRRLQEHVQILPLVVEATAIEVTWECTAIVLARPQVWKEFLEAS